MKLKLQYFGHLMWRADSLILGKTEGRRRGRQRMRWLDFLTDLMDMGLSKLWGIVKDSGAWRAAVHGVIKSWTWLSDWTTMFSFYREDWIVSLFQGTRAVVTSSGQWIMRGSKRASEKVFPDVSSPVIQACSKLHKREISFCIINPCSHGLLPPFQNLGYLD